MKIGIYPGSFDPITLGHLDIIKRAMNIVDVLIVGVLYNKNKNKMLSADERVELIKSCTNHLKNIKVVSFDGLLVNYCQDHRIGTLIRGVRTGADIEYELQMAHMNR